MRARNPEWSNVAVAHDRVPFVPKGPSRTRQEFQDECDINVLMARYKTTGVMPSMNGSAPRYLDLTDTPDLMTSLNIMNEATEAFMRLPSDVRRTFDNDPAEFVKFASDRENLPQMRQWGLAAPEAAPQPPIRVAIDNPVEPAPPAPKAP